MGSAFSWRLQYGALEDEEKPNRRCGFTEALGYFGANQYPLTHLAPAELRSNRKDPQGPMMSHPRAASLSWGLLCAARNLFDIYTPHLFPTIFNPLLYDILKKQHSEPFLSRELGRQVDRGLGDDLPVWGEECEPTDGLTQSHPPSPLVCAVLAWVCLGSLQAWPFLLSFASILCVGLRGHRCPQLQCLWSVSAVQPELSPHHPL